MPQIGWIIKGEKRTHEWTLNLAATYPADFPFTVQDLDAMWQGAREGKTHSLRPYPSPTLIMGCARSEVLKRELPYWLDPFKTWPMRRGTLAHKLLEEGRHEDDAIIENNGTPLRCSIELPDGTSFILQGTPDKVVINDRVLIDYKTVDELKNTPKGTWPVQLSLYRYMLWLHGIEIEKAFIQQIGMKEPRRLYVTLFPLAWAEKYIQERAPAFVKVLNGEFNLDNLPEILNFTLDTDNTWRCYDRGKGAWCEVRDACMARLREDGK